MLSFRAKTITRVRVIVTVEEPAVLVGSGICVLKVNMADEIYQVEVKKRFRTADEQNELRWVVRPVAEVIMAAAVEYRCKDCGGKVRLHGKHVPNGPASHAEHMSRQDSEYCPVGMHFRQNSGRSPRRSHNPVE